MRGQTVARGDHADDEADSLPYRVKNRSLVNPGYSTEGMLDFAQFNSVSLVLDLIVLAADEVDLAIFG